MSILYPFAVDGTVSPSKARPATQCELADALHAKALIHGGITLTRKGEKVASGYAVGIIGHEGVCDGLADVEDWLRAKWGLLSEHPDVVVGSWWDEDRKRVVLDLVKVLPDEAGDDEAVTYARLQGQKALFHLTTGREIRA